LHIFSSSFQSKLTVKKQVKVSNIWKRKKKKNHIKFVILLLLLFSFVMHVNLRRNIYTQKKTPLTHFILYKTSEIEGEWKEKREREEEEEEEKLHFLPSWNIEEKKMNNMALLWLVCFLFLSHFHINNFYILSLFLKFYIVYSIWSKTVIVWTTDQWMSGRPFSTIQYYHIDTAFFTLSILSCP
jgi:hypothetical protein